MNEISLDEIMGMVMHSLYEAVGFFLLVDLVAFSAANTVGLYAIFLVILKGEPNIKTSIYKGLYDGYTFSYFER